jgi:hypothetical protein
VPSPEAGASAERLQGLSSWARRSPWSAAWLAATLAFAAFFATLHPIFQVPDDPYIMFTMDGYFHGEPDYHTIYMSTLLTRVLAQLYVWLPGVSWYGVAVYGLHFAAVVVWLYLFVRRPRAPLDVVLFLFAFFAITLPMMLEVTYSSAALAAGAMGIFLHFERSGEPGAWGAPIVGAAMVALSYLTRDEVFPALLLPTVPMLVFRARSVPLRRHAAALGLLLVLIVPARGLDSDAYASSDWQEYLRRFTLCFELHATPRLEPSPELIALADEAGWSENDLLLFANFVYADPEVYSESSIATIVEGTAGLDWARNPLQAVRDRIIGDHSVELLIIILNLAIFLPRMVRRDRWIALVLSAAFSGGALYLATFQRFPTRLALPITGMVVSWLVVAPHARREILGWIRKPGVRRGVACALAVILLAVPLVELVSKSRELDEDREGFLASLELAAQVAARPVIIALGELPFENVSPLTTGGDLPQFDYVGVGWRQHSPSYNAHLERLGIENVYLAAIERRDVFLTMREDVYPLYEEFVREHYQREAALEPLFPINDRVLLYGSSR